MRLILKVPDSAACKKLRLDRKICSRSGILSYGSLVGNPKQGGRTPKPIAANSSSVVSCQYQWHDLSDCCLLR